jgi:hypothetical protein
MRRHGIAILAALFFCATTAHAHLCNDVFVQAKDNLAVKVDIRDGQLRIDEEAGFRVYLLNTMDRDIVSIALEVESDAFDATVRPSPEWKSFPRLRSVKRRGEKVYFDVTLNRKRATPDGRYRIALKLVNGKNRNQAFKSVDLNEACATHALKPAGAIAVDGKATRQEWAGAILCTDFYEYVKKGRYFENHPLNEPTRFRLAADEQRLYCLFGAQGGDDAEADLATLYLAGDTDRTPAKLTVDLRDATARLEGMDATVECRRAGRDMIECSVPLSALKLGPENLVYANFTRTLRGGKTPRIAYWRGNRYSVENPVVYDKFRLPR